MSEVLEDLQGRVFHGFAQVRVAGPQGMISVRADLSGPALAQALGGAGLGVPAQRRILRADSAASGLACAWMSPDELLVLCPQPRAASLAAELAAALAGVHALVTDVSDARALFEIAGPRAGQVLMKLCPVDLAAMAPDEMRRSRVAQVAAAFWRTGDGYALVTFRSVAGYAAAVLANAAAAGGEIGAAQG